MVLRPSLLRDRVLSFIMIAVTIGIVGFCWFRYPRPVEGGPLILGMAAALAVTRFYRKPAHRALLGSTAAAMLVILATLAVLQAGAWRGWI